MFIQLTSYKNFLRILILGGAEVGGHLYYHLLYKSVITPKTIEVFEYLISIGIPIVEKNNEGNLL